MPKFYHVTKVAKLYDITKSGGGLKPSSGLGAGGMSADSAEAYKYAEQDKGLVYLWTDEDYTDRFKKEGEKYAMIMVTVDDGFVKTNMRAPKKTKGEPIDGTTAVCDILIPLENLTYKRTLEGPEVPLRDWGKFDMRSGQNDRTIWEGAK